MVNLRLFFGEQQQKPKDSKGWKPPAQRALIVNTVEVGNGSVARHLDTNGTLEGVNQASIVPETSGTVRQVLVREGDWVKKGALLAELINPNLTAATERAGIELERAKRDRKG